MNWDKISRDPRLSIAFLQEHKENINWMDVSLHISLTKEILETFQDELFWTCVPVNPYLTPSLLEEIKDCEYVDWGNISFIRPITIEFYNQFEDYLDMRKMMLNPMRKIEFVSESVMLEDGTMETRTIAKEKEKPTLQSYIENIPTSKRALEAKMESRKKIFESYKKGADKK